ncbi:maleylpyruvate isomerase family mycothiol-dependent enzyme [Microlunatus speluncae]|uniref:maleylpyruvate isomerase family mycothiol-dependent enzyme n=1 Tax=Microlunatus speluncae TaxID=2594267 RepID=UPI001266433E|nr:maleylpyruvate isomerase family mycothiol-dependent enzyme [Microlunatus speluncae]
MSDQDLWSAIDAQRERTVDLLDRLTDQDWTRSSLCAGWTVRDVAAHLTLQQLSVGDLLRFMIRHPGILGGMNRIITRSAQAKAIRPTDQLIGEIRAMIGSRRHNVGVTPAETLIDIAVHGQDIAIPLGRELELPAETAAIAATRVWSYRGRGMAAVFDSIPLTPYRLTATDVAWTEGDGPEIRGQITDLLLLLTGRPATLSRLEGPGIDLLRERLGHYPAT